MVAGPPASSALWRADLTHPLGPELARPWQNPSEKCGLKSFTIWPTYRDYIFMRLLVTGGAGFIGSAVCRHLIADTDAEVINVDKLTYAGNLESLGDTSSSPRYRFVKADICDEAVMKSLFAQTSPTAILHLAAE